MIFNYYSTTQPIRTQPYREDGRQLLQSKCRRGPTSSASYKINSQIYPLGDAQLCQATN